MSGYINTPLRHSEISIFYSTVDLGIELMRLIGRSDSIKWYLWLKGNGLLWCVCKYEGSVPIGTERLQSTLTHTHRLHPLSYVSLSLEVEHCMNIGTISIRKNGTWPRCHWTWDSWSGVKADLNWGPSSFFVHVPLRSVGTLKAEGFGTWQCSLLLMAMGSFTRLSSFIGDRMTFASVGDFFMGAFKNGFN